MGKSKPTPGKNGYLRKYSFKTAKDKVLDAQSLTRGYSLKGFR